MTGSVRAVVLAAQRPGVTDPLAERFGLSHKCLVPIRGRPLIAHVVATLARHAAIGQIAISVEEVAWEAIRAELPDLEAAGGRIGFVASAANLADSVLAAAGDHDGPVLITTADNVLLRPESVDAILAALADADLALAMAPREAVLAAHPAGQRRFYRFRDGAFSNCNLYGVAGFRALGAAEVFRGGGQFAKKAGRIIEAFGLINLVLLRLRLVSLAAGLGRISRRIGWRIAPVILADGSQAIDVDNGRTYAVVHELLGRREPEPAAEAQPLRRVA